MNPNPDANERTAHPHRVRTDSGGTTHPNLDTNGVEHEMEHGVGNGVGGAGVTGLDGAFLPIFRQR
jgi:hypothetical protein